MPLDVAAWELDVVYSCSQKGLGAPSGVAPIVFAPTALARKIPCRSFAFDLSLLEDYWVRRKYHHTMCASLIYALREALMVAEEEGLKLRWARHERHHHALVAGLEAMGLTLAASNRRAIVDAERGARARRRRRGGSAAALASALQHRDRRWPGPACRQDLARRTDGKQLHRSARHAVPRRAPEVHARLTLFLELPRPIRLRCIGFTDLQST